MDQPPGSLDDLQPQDLSSTCGIPSVVDLTRKGEANTSLEAMRMVKSPRWCPPNSGNGRTGLPLAEAAAAASDIGVQSGNQIQSDNAFSNTTVTLSYVSRSRVFSSQDSLSAHSSLYSVPSITKFSLQSSCESENGLGEGGFALGQHYLQHSDGPLDLATRAQLLQALTQAQVGDKNDESQLCLTQPGSHGLNGGPLCGEGEADACVQGAFENSLLMETESALGLENGGQCHSWPSSGPSSTNTGDHKRRGHSRSNEPLLVSGTPEPSGAGDGDGAAGGKHGSASATSPDQLSVPCPQASRLPSAANSCPEEAGEVIWAGLDAENPMEPYPSEKAQCSGDCPPRPDGSVETTSPARKCKVAPKPSDLTCHEGFSKEVSARNPQNNKLDVLPHVNGNTETLPGSSPPRRKLPVRLGRGTRLEAMVLNICPSAYKVHNGKTTPKATKKAVIPSPSPSPPGKEGYPTGGQKKAVMERQKAASTSHVGKTDGIITDNCKDSTSDCEIFNNSKNMHNGTPSKASAASWFPAQGKSKALSSVPPQIYRPDLAAELEPGEVDFPYTLPEAGVTFVTPTKSPKKSPPGSKGAASGGGGGRVSPRKAAARPPRRRRKVPPGGPASSMFSPAEPEIKLKYVTYKEERRDPRFDSFSPLVRTHPQQQPSSSARLYSVINYAEEDSTRLDGGHPAGSSGGILSGTTPGTSCLRPGRISVHGQHRRPLVCCLCGASANATGLGDLHGPYYPDGYRATGKTKAGVSSPKANAEEEGGDEEEEEEESSDSDSSASSCSMRGAGGRQRARPPPGSWPQSSGAVHPQQTGDSGGPAAAKQARMEAGGGLKEAVDWYSPPVVAHEPCEYWLHEDCCIWAAGVFLVKGKVYGLEEAVKVAQATTCSGCRRPGATLGCLLKGCPSKYHYRCALEADCVLVEENFSMRCKKHKNKSLKTPSGNQRDGR